MVGGKSSTQRVYNKVSKLATKLLTYVGDITSVQSLTEVLIRELMLATVLRDVTMATDYHVFSLVEKII